MATATLETIRDRIIALIEALTPTSLAGNPFRVSRDEHGADFQAWAEQHPAACLRRFQVIDDGTDDIPIVSNVDMSKLRARFSIVIAYPQSHRYGPGAGRDRRDVMDEDWRALNFVAGIYGRGSFSGTNDCTPLGAVKSIERGEKVDFLIATAEYEYTLDLIP